MRFSLLLLGLPSPVPGALLPQQHLRPRAPSSPLLSPFLLHRLPLPELAPKRRALPPRYSPLLSLWRKTLAQRFCLDKASMSLKKRFCFA